MAANKPVTLLHLPDELLGLVVEQLDQDRFTLSTLSLVCRRLGRIAQNRLYRDVNVTSKRGFDAFHAALTARPQLRMHVKNLAITWRLNKRSAATSDDSSDEEAPQEVNSDLHNGEESHRVREICDVLRLPALERLNLSSFAGRHLHAILSVTSSTGSLPQLRVLRCSGMSRGLDTVQVPELWRALASFKLLDELHLLAEREVPLPSSQDECLAIQNLRTLSAWGTCFMGDFAPLSSLFPTLQSLEILSLCSAQALERALATASPSLRSINLMAVSGPVPLERYLGRLAELQELTVVQGSAYTALLPILQASSIRQLRFLEASTPSERFVLDLVAGPRRMKCLERLSIEAIEGVLRGEDIYEELRYWGPEYTEENVLDRIREFKQDHRPALTSGWTDEGLARLVEAAAASNIKLDSDVESHIGWNADWDAQIERCLVDKAFETNDLDVLIACYGRQGAAAAIRRQRTKLIELLDE